ncbi:hypothetical protein HW555_013384 [Spodoptera exigua]|uniref:LIM zinc-binding domain-containing protein n=1 Tax=Spodoptera exigua TaxID=7107 RepID=A0A835G5F0_SPOEX|nr:hypothetical protein HW555_013384 [Spodoptera exigua]
MIRASTSPVPPPSQGGTLPRPGTKQVTVTVQETVVEPAQSQQQPPPTVPAVRHHHHASNATKELDDLMASLSDFKVQYRSASVTATSAHCTTAVSSFPFIIIFTTRLSWSTAISSRARSRPSSGRLVSLALAQSPPSKDSSQHYITGVVGARAYNIRVHRQTFHSDGIRSNPPRTAGFTSVSGTGAESGTHVYREKRAWQEHYRSNPRQPESASLEHMLGSLRADMSRQGVQTPQKGCCNACDKPIVGQVITALGRTWHPEHFTCAHCNQELGTRNFFERDGRPYCEPDYHNLFSPRCAYCNGPILDKCVTALEKTWHTEHFFCAQCGQQFGEDGFHERDGKPYCRNDYFDMFAPKCGGCNKPIMENYISALNTQWHPDCFVCKDCEKAVKGKSFYAMEGKPVCPKCVGVDEDE